MHPTALWFLMAVSASLSLSAGLQMGEKLAGARLTDPDGNIRSLEEYQGKILVIEFWSFKCPVSLAYDLRMVALHSKYGSRGVSILAVAPNKNESAAEVRRNAENLRLPYPVLLDPEGILADRLGATHTPSVAILDHDGTLLYRGAIDNNRRVGEKGRVAYAEEAIEAILAGRSVPQAETKAFGCSIRR